MVAIKNHEADRFLKRPSPGTWLYLFFGPDAGLVWERATEIAHKAVPDRHDSFQLIKFDGDALAADPGRLADEANTIGLFGGSRCIQIDAGSRNFIAAIEPLTTDPPNECTIVITAGDLKGDSALRKLVSRYPRGAAVECYPDTPKQLEQIIDDEMNRAGLRIEPGARDFLSSHLGADRLITRAEIRKLALYMHGQKIVGEKHVEAIIADAASLNLDEPIFLAFSGNYQAATEAGYRTFSQIDPGVFIGFVLRHVLMLHKLRTEIDRGVPLETIGERLPRIYFGPKKTGILNQLRSWKTDRLLLVIQDLAEASQATRRNSRAAERLAIRSLWRIARGSRQAI